MQLTLQEVEKRLRRWHTRLTRASNEVAKLEKKRRRLAADWIEAKPKTLADRPRAHDKGGDHMKVTKVADEIPLPELDAFFAPGRPENSKLTDDLTIPPELKRT